MSFTAQDLLWESGEGPSGIKISLDFNKLVKRLGDKWETVLTEVLPAISSRAAGIAPRRTGTMASKIGSKVKPGQNGQLAKGYIYANAEGPKGSRYSLWVEIGTGFHPHSRNRRLKSGNLKGRRLNSTPGYKGIYRKAQPYLYPAVMSGKTTLLSKLGDGDL